MPKQSHKVVVLNETFKDIFTGMKSYVLVQPALNVSLDDTLEIKQKPLDRSKTLQVKVTHIEKVTPKKTIVSFNF